MFLIHLSLLIVSEWVYRNIHPFPSTWRLLPSSPVNQIRGRCLCRQPSPSTTTGWRNGGEMLIKCPPSHIICWTRDKPNYSVKYNRSRLLKRLAKSRLKHEYIIMFNLIIKILEVPRILLLLWQVWPKLNPYWIVLNMFGECGNKFMIIPRAYC